MYCITLFLQTDWLNWQHGRPNNINKLGDFFENFSQTSYLYSPTEQQKFYGKSILRTEFVLDFVYKIPGVFKNKKLSFQGNIFVRRFLCHTSCCSVFLAEKAYFDILSHVLRVNFKHGHFIFLHLIFPQ